MAFFDIEVAELPNYRPEVRRPEDFNEFWAQTLSEAREFPTQLELGERYDLGAVTVFDATFHGYDGHEIKAWYSRPTNISDELPMIVQYQGYGGGRGLPIDHTFWPTVGYAHLMMDSRGQGGSWGHGGATADPAPGTAAGHPGQMTSGIDAPANHYFRRLITDAVRAVDAGRVQAGIDASRIVVAGASQGGGLALAVTGLVPDLRAALIDVPFLCHYERAVTISDAYPYQEIRKYLSVYRDQIEPVYQVLSYFDGVNFAPSAHAQALFSVALMDTTCPPSTVYAAFNRYGAGADQAVPKEIAIYPYNGHEGGEGHQKMRQLEYLRALL